MNFDEKNIRILIYLLDIVLVFYLAVNYKSKQIKKIIEKEKHDYHHIDQKTYNFVFNRIIFGDIENFRYRLLLSGYCKEEDIAKFERKYIAVILGLSSLAVITNLKKEY